MDCFKCYTLAENGLSEGISRKVFDCILQSPDGKCSIRHAAIQTLPLLPLNNKNPLLIASLGLTFLHEMVGKLKVRTDGVIIAANPRLWRLCTSQANVVLLDPSGIQAGGTQHMVLLFIPEGDTPTLANTATCTQLHVVGGVPTLQVFSKSSMLYEALQLPAGATIQATAALRLVAPEEAPTDSANDAQTELSATHRSRNLILAESTFF